MIIEQIIDDINGREHPSDEDSVKKEKTAAKQS
jgi:hypothetical protein